MSTPTIDYDALAAKYGGKPQIDYDSLAAKYGGKPVAASLDANPNGQGTYPMWDTAGTLHQIPYSLVPVAHGQGYQFDTNPIKDSGNASRNGLLPMQAFIKDEAADPNRVGGTSLPMQPSGSTWNGSPEPANRQESIARQLEADRTAPRGWQAVTGVMKGGAQLAMPLAHVMNAFDHSGTTPEEMEQLNTAQTPIEKTGKYATVAAPIVAGAIAAPAATASALAGGAVGNYAGGKIAEMAGMTPEERALTQDALSLAGGVGAAGIRPTQALGAAGEAPVAGAEGPVNTVSLANKIAGGLPQFMPESVRNGTLASAWDWAKNAPRELLAGNIHEPIPGTNMTPADRYASMQAMGIQPNAAEATNSPILNAAERLNQNSLTSASMYEKARAANLRALNDYTEKVLDDMSEMNPEEGGEKIKQGLRNAQVNLQNQATKGFNTLDDLVGNRKMPGSTLQRAAKNIYDSYSDYASHHPALVPKEAWKVVQDLAGVSNDPQFSPRAMSFSELHQLRSDLLEMVRSNPDIVKNQAGGWLEQLARAADETMTSGKPGSLNPAGVKIFRDANEAWANMKSTFDNPSHPFYQAARTPTASKLVQGIGQSPEMVNALKSVLSPDKIGAIQRGVLEKALGTTKEGNYNFKNFQGMWNKLPKSYRNALFSPEQIQHIEDIGNAGTVLNMDLNPSSSAKLGQKIMEGSGGAGAIGPAVTGHPIPLAGAGVYHGTQYGIGRLMNNPGFVDWLMRGRGFEPVGEVPSTASRVLPAAATASEMDGTGPAGQPNFYSQDYLKAKAAFDAARTGSQ